MLKIEACQVPKQSEEESELYVRGMDEESGRKGHKVEHIAEKAHSNDVELLVASLAKVAIFFEWSIMADVFAFDHILDALHKVNSYLNSSPSSNRR